MEYKGKRFTVLGLGLSGYSAARLLIELGGAVFVSDSRTSPKLESQAKKLRALGAAVELGGHTDAVYRLADEIVISPGVSPDIDILRRALRSKPRLSIIPEI
ncbi:UDP-N-acetylmuramoyl-L-alanine--D-glutamate ligase, partial [bacterium]|nr:UDP-N-acetylmuramoyl-L-alanine--D-glutamate ligase [bacterium]